MRMMAIRYKIRTGVQTLAHIYMYKDINKNIILNKRNFVCARC